MTENNLHAEIGVYGSSGLSELLENPQIVKMATPYGDPSDEITIAELFGKRVAFLPRHGKTHHLPPHKIPYLANAYAFKKLGIKWVISPCASGSLKKEIKPGDFVINDQYINFTNGRKDTFFDGKVSEINLDLYQEHSDKVVHVSSAMPYCVNMRDLAINACRHLNITCHNKGTVIVIQGPRFATTAESKFYSQIGGDTINMTQYPEVALAKELEMCVVPISLITDYDAGLHDDPTIKAVDLDTVVKVFNENNEKVKKLIFEIIKNVKLDDLCECHSSLKGAVWN
jgi:5'-methylthioadenosine phosphorylase